MGDGCALSHPQPSHSSKHARRGQGGRRAQRGTRRGRPRLYLSEPARVSGCSGAEAGLSSPRAGRDLAGAGHAVIGRGLGAASLSWAAGLRRFHFAPRSLQVSSLQERLVPRRRRRRRRRHHRYRHHHRLLTVALRVLFSAASIASDCWVRPAPAAATHSAPFPWPSSPQCLTLTLGLRNAR